MKRTHRASLASWLLHIVAADNEPLAGDLLEERRAGRSAWWFWTQLACAVSVVAWHARSRSRTPTVAHAIAGPPFGQPNRRLPLLDPATLNLSGIRVQGIGGLGLIAVVVLISITMPAAWWLAATGLASGAVLGVFLIVHRRRAGGLAGGGGDRPLTLFGSRESASSVEDHGPRRWLQATAVAPISAG